MNILYWELSQPNRYFQMDQLGTGIESVTKTVTQMLYPLCLYRKLISIWLLQTWLFLVVSTTLSVLLSFDSIFPTVSPFTNTFPDFWISLITNVINEFVTLTPYSIISRLLSFITEHIYNAPESWDVHTYCRCSRLFRIRLMCNFRNNLLASYTIWEIVANFILS